MYVGFNWEPLCKGANLLLDKFYHWETFIGTHRLQMDQMTPPTTFCLASERENLPWQEGTGTLSQRPQRWDPAVDAKHFINKGGFTTLKFSVIISCKQNSVNQVLHVYAWFCIREPEVENFFSNSKFLQFAVTSFHTDNETVPPWHCSWISWILSMLIHTSYRQ